MVNRYTTWLNKYTACLNFSVHTISQPKLIYFVADITAKSHVLLSGATLYSHHSQPICQRDHEKGDYFHLEYNEYFTQALS